MEIDSKYVMTLWKCFRKSTKFSENNKKDKIILSSVFPKQGHSLVILRKNFYKNQYIPGPADKVCLGIETGDLYL